MVNPSKLFADEDLSDAVFRETDLSRARMYGVLLTGANLDGDITGLVVNGVEVAPLIEAELDRRHPERIALRAATNPARDADSVCPRRRRVSPPYVVRSQVGTDGRSLPLRMSAGAPCPG